MNTGHQWKFIVLSILSIMGLVVGCTRNIAVTPLAATVNTPTPAFTSTNTPTNTATNTSTSTATATHTNTPTSTNTPTATYTPIFSYTFTNTFTNTNTPTVTSTFTNTFTSTFTGTPTFTFTATSTPTNTSTPTPDPRLIDDWEDGDNVVLANGGRTGWENTANDGTGTTSPVPGSFMPETLAGQGAGGSNNYVHMTGSGQTGYGSSFLLQFMNPLGNYDISAYTGFVFYVKLGTTPGAVGKTLFNVATQENTADGSDYHCMPVCLGNSWTPVTVFFSQLHQQGWGPSGGTTAFNPAHAQQLIWSFAAGVTVDFYLDNVSFTTAADPGAEPNTRVDMLRDGSAATNPNLTGRPAGSQGWSTYEGNAPINIQPVDANVIQCGGTVSPFRARDYGHLYDNAGNYQSYTMTERLWGISGGVTNLYNAQAAGWTGIKFYVNNKYSNLVGTTFNQYFYVIIQETVPGTDGGNCSTHCWDHPGILLNSYNNMGWTLVQKPFTQVNWANVGGGWTYAPAPSSLGAYPTGLSTITELQVANTSNGNAIDVDIDISLDDIEFY